MKYSVIMTTRRKIDGIKHAFLVSDKEAEFILVDSTFNEETKNELKKLEHDYCRIVYAPLRHKKIFKRDFSLGLNTALMYAEGKWVIKIDDSTEFKPDFFDVLTDDIVKLADYYKNEDFVLRPVKLEGWGNDKKWEPYHILNGVKERYIGLGRNGLGGIAFTTLDQAIFRRDSIDMLNGYDERYDMGHGYDDNDLFQRFLTLHHNVVMDQKLMTYQYGHEIRPDFVDFVKILFQFTFLEIQNGRHMAYNNFDLKSEREKMLKNKEEYIL